MKIIKVFFAIVHLVVFVLLLGTLLNEYVPPKNFPWLNLLSLAFPVLIIFYFFLSLFWIFIVKKKAIVVILIGFVFIKPVQRWINFSFTKDETPNLKIVTFNAESGILGEEALRTYLEKENADIVFFQESRFHKNERLQIDKLDFRAVCYIAEIQTNCKILREGTIFDENFEGTSSFADIEFNGKIIRLINIYLSPFSFDKQKVKPSEDLGQNEGKVRYILRRLIPTFKIHQKEVLAIRKAIDESPYPVIVAGDFNAVPNSYEYYTIGKNLTDAFVAVGSGSSTSFHDYKFPIRIDYIFTSKEIRPLRYRVDRSVKLSDHFPVIAEFKLN